MASQLSRGCPLRDELPILRNYPNYTLRTRIHPSGFLLPASTLLSPVSGCALHYTIRTHQSMMKAMHLVPENAVVGINDAIPGLVEGERDPKFPALRK